MITKLFKVEVSFPEDSVNYFTSEYTFKVLAATKEALSSESQLIDNVVTETAVFDDENLALDCEKQLKILSKTY